MSHWQFHGKKGADIASAAPLVIGANGDFFDVTGTTDFAAMTVGADRMFALQFDGILTITHGASLLLPGAANITTAAGDVAVFQSTAADTVVCVSYTKADGKAVVETAATPEGTAIKSTGETGGAKYLREDGDDTCSWQDPRLIGTASYAADQLLTAEQCKNYTIYVTGAATISLPAVAAGSSVTIITVGAILVSVAPDANDKIWLNGAALDDGDMIDNASTAGDRAVLTYYSTDGWHAAATGWTDGGATT